MGFTIVDDIPPYVPDDESLDETSSLHSSVAADSEDESVSVSEVSPGLLGSLGSFLSERIVAIQGLQHIWKPH